MAIKLPNNLQRADAPDLELTEDKVKVKITKALLSEADVAVYSGATRVKYPVVPGRFAIGQVTEAAEDSYMKKGDRVYLAGVTEDEVRSRRAALRGRNGKRLLPRFCRRGRRRGVRASRFRLGRGGLSHRRRGHGGARGR
ncbi:MAG: alcohol dehydrogenase catalytic domain-containing protein [Christensenellaceae bacterium]